MPWTLDQSEHQRAPGIFSPGAPRVGMDHGPKGEKQRVSWRQGSGRGPEGNAGEGTR